VIDPVAALDFLWAGQDGLFVLAMRQNDGYRRRLYDRNEALSSLVGYEYFGPLARISAGSALVATRVGNVLWADIDDTFGLDERLTSCVPATPSLLVFSGNRGFWAFWKLSRLIAVEEIEALNRGIAERLKADKGSCKPLQLARLPGSFRKETERFAEVVSFPGNVYDPEQFSPVCASSFSRLIRACVDRLSRPG
jgi:hypothetical protein